VGDDGQIQRVGVLEGPLHEARVHDGPAVVGETGRARLLEIAELGEHLPLGAPADGGDGVDAGQARLLGLPQDELRDGAVVVDGVGIGHAGDRGEAARHGRRAPRLDGLLVLEARLPQVGVDVDEPRDDELAPDVDYRHSGIPLLSLAVVHEIAPRGGDLPSLDEDVQHVVDLLRGVDDPSSPEQRRHDLPPDKR